MQPKVSLLCALFLAISANGLPTGNPTGVIAVRTAPSDLAPELAHGSSTNTLVLTDSVDGTENVIVVSEYICDYNFLREFNRIGTAQGKVTSPAGPLSPRIRFINIYISKYILIQSEIA